MPRYRQTRIVRGQLLVPETTDEYLPIPSAWHLKNEKLRSALLNFIVLRGETVTACQADPWLFEAVVYGEEASEYEYRVKGAVDKCAECPLFDPCQRMGDTLTMGRPEITWVVAGYLYDSSRSAITVRRRLKMEKVMSDDDIFAPAQDA